MTHPLFFSSSDFTDESEAVLLIGLLTEFRRILAAGQWLTPYICSCCFFLSRRFRRWRRFFFVGLFLSHRFTQIYTDFFHRKVFHRISRMNRKAFLLIGLLTDFRGYLAAGQWLAPDMCCYCFLSRRFRRWRRFFFVGLFCPTDFTDLHRFFSSEGFSSDFTDESEGILAYRITHGFSQIFGRWPMAGARYVLLCFWSRRFRRWRRFFFVWLFLSHRFHRYTQIFLNLRWIALSDLRGYLQRPNRSPPRNSVSNRRNKKSPNKFRVIRWWKNLRHLRNLRDLKNVPRKICVDLWNLWDFFRSQGVSVTTEQVASAKFRE